MSRLAKQVSVVRELNNRIDKAAGMNPSELANDDEVVFAEDRMH